MPVNKTDKSTKPTLVDELSKISAAGVGKVAIETIHTAEFGRISTALAIDEDTSEKNRLEIGEHLFNLVVQERLNLTGAHARVFEEGNLKATLHYLNFDRNAPAECDTSETKDVQELLAVIHQIDPNDTPPSLVGVKEIEIPHQIYDHVLPENRKMTPFVTVREYNAKGILAGDGWMVNGQKLNSFINQVGTPLHGAPVTATYAYLASSAMDQRPITLPEKPFHRIVEKGNHREVQMWGNPTQTAEQRLRNVATYTQFDALKNPTKHTEEFSTDGVSSLPDNLVASLSDGSHVIYIAGSVQEVARGSQPANPAPYVGWLRAHYDANGKLAKAWKKCHNPFVYQAPKIKPPKDPATERHAHFEPSATLRDPTWIESINPQTGNKQDILNVSDEKVAIKKDVSSSPADAFMASKEDPYDKLADLHRNSFESTFHFSKGLLPTIRQHFYIDEEGGHVNVSNKRLSTLFKQAYDLTGLDAAVVQAKYKQFAEGILKYNNFMNVVFGKNAMIKSRFFEAADFPATLPENIENRYQTYCALDALAQAKQNVDGFITLANKAAQNFDRYYTRYAELAYAKPNAGENLHSEEKTYMRNQVRKAHAEMETAFLSCNEHVRAAGVINEFLKEQGNPVDVEWAVDAHEALEVIRRDVILFKGIAKKLSFLDNIDVVSETNVDRVSRDSTIAVPEAGLVVLRHPKIPRLGPTIKQKEEPPVLPPSPEPVPEPVLPPLVPPAPVEQPVAPAQTAAPIEPIEPIEPNIVQVKMPERPASAKVVTVLAPKDEPVKKGKRRKKTMSVKAAEPALIPVALHKAFGRAKREAFTNDALPKTN